VAQLEKDLSREFILSAVEGFEMTGPFFCYYCERDARNLSRRAT
jgi:hypothetical protein